MLIYHTVSLSCMTQYLSTHHIAKKDTLKLNKCESSSSYRLFMLVICRYKPGRGAYDIQWFR